ncbi:hypothetical protein C5142_01740 [Rhodococcus sp. BGS-1C]|nr:hypothetical protein [Rhodococcus sp. KRD197]
MIELLTEIGFSVELTDPVPRTAVNTTSTSFEQFASSLLLPVGPPS